MLLKIRGRYSILGMLFFLILIAVVILGALFSYLISPIDKNNTAKKSFVIPRGASAREISEKLNEQGFIRNSLVFRAIVKFSGKAGSIPSGDYLLSPSMGASEILDAFKAGPKDLWVSIPEGLRKEEIGLKIASTLEEKNFSLDEFMSLSTSPENLEGYLFPDTYLIPKEASPQTVISILKGNFDKKVKALIEERNNSLTAYQTIILASLLEREAKLSDDRQIIAGILIKRIRSGWTLDIDATLQYAKASSRCLDSKFLIKDIDCKWWDIPSREDKQVNSAFNTYKVSGFPPTPISNPGLASIKAASNPVDSAYWFYISDEKGKIHFATTLEEQQANINKYLR
jgi:UPF0755 protein